MSSKTIFPFLLIICFALGAWIWQTMNTQNSHSRMIRNRYHTQQKDHDILVTVNDIEIKQENVEFEMKVLTTHLQEQDISSIPETYPESGQISRPLKENIIDSLVERLMLYQIVSKDENFSLDDPGRYTECVRSWMLALQSQPKLFSSEQDKAFLKARLCEQDVIRQYLKEVLYSQIHISEDDISDYYRKNKNLFFQPLQVVIRQIVLADERKARKIKSTVTRSNFAKTAIAHSISPEAQDGGLFPSFSKGYRMPHFFDVAFSMRHGQISEILKSTYGFHIIMLEKKIPEHFLTLEEATPVIREHLSRQEQEKAYQKWVDFALHSTRISTPGTLW
ncbi:MAG: peptidyl-prolyl cis-trans isomerase [Deltaproteobacteria bacterium]|nr:peptidyl-prolyl cis-trans isomerase [Deltaproteobacteria bacterium]